MIQGKQICPAGSGREISEGAKSSGTLPKWFRKLRGLFHSAPAAMSGNSSKVMDDYMKFQREHRGA